MHPPKPIYIKGKFSGQYTAQKDTFLSFSFEKTHYDIEIDTGKIVDFVISNKNEWESVETDLLARQNYFKKVKCIPLKQNENFDGFILEFTEVKVLNVQTSSIQKTNSDITIGDISCDFYGYIKGEEENIIIPSSVEKTQFFDKNKEYKKTEYKKGASFKSNNNKGGCLIGVIDGCASFIGVLIGFIAILFSLYLLFNLSWGIILFIALIIGIIYLFSRFNNAATTGVGCVISLLNSAVFLLVLIAMFSGLLKQCDSDYSPPYKTPKFSEDDTETVKKSPIKNTSNNNSETDTLITHKRVWYDFNRRKLKVDISVRQSDVKKASVQRENFQLFDNDLGPVYEYCRNSNDQMLDYTYRALDELKVKYRLNDKEFAEAIITMVQDIPYRFVLQWNCDDTEHYSENTINFLSRCNPNCCIGNIKFGLQAPAEFIGNLYGDCDTRTVLLYTILKHYKYDVVIINSKQYMHSMLGINSIHYNGAYKTKGVKKYYFIETTSNGFYPGTIDSKLNNKTLWKIVTN